METFFSFVGFGISALCFAVGAAVIGYGTVDAIRFVQRRLREAVGHE